MRNFFVFIIRIYQNTLSPDHGPLFWLGLTKNVCVFEPTCSEYAIAAIQKYGSVKGIVLGAKRIWRCHPWQKEHFDPLEKA